MRISPLHDPNELKAIGKKIREKRGVFSQEWLARKVGTSVPVISYIERGLRLVPKKTVPLFSKALKIPENELIPSSAQQIESVRSSIKEIEAEMGIGFRELRTLPEEARVKLIEQYKKLKEEYSDDKKSFSISPKKPEEVAASILKKCGMSKTAPIDLNKIAQMYSMKIEKSNLIDSDGWIVYQMDKKWAAIKYRENLSWGRSRFTIAHEMGHFFLDNLDESEASCSIDDNNTDRERAANDFAAGLLMPEKTIIEKIGSNVQGIEDILKMSQMFEVSQTAAAIRLIRLTNIPSAVIVSENGKIKWGFCSNGMYLKVKRTKKLSQKTQASKMGKRGSDGELKDPIETKCDYWFYGKMPGKWLEHSTRLYKNSVLSLVWKG
jgi:Zn-dependent peptidase ImmA (M78 family)/transcriptional regulator with XRE-family HTH domain